MKKLPKLKDDDVISVTSKKELRRISVHLLLNQILSFFNFEKGYSKSLLLLLKHPGNHIKSYLSVERNQLTNPFKFYFIGATLFGFSYLQLYSIKQVEIENNFEGDNEFKTIFLDNIHLWFFLVVFFIAFFSYFLFKKQSGYNWAENLVFNLYVTGLILLMNSVLIPLDLVFKNNTTIKALTNLPALFYFVYAYLSFFKGNKFKTILFSLTSIVLGITSLIFTIILVGMVYGFLQATI